MMYFILVSYVLEDNTISIVQFQFHLVLPKIYLIKRFRHILSAYLAPRILVSNLKDRQSVIDHEYALKQLSEKYKLQIATLDGNYKDAGATIKQLRLDQGESTRRLTAQLNNNKMLEAEITRLREIPPDTVATENYDELLATYNELKNDHEHTVSAFQVERKANEEQRNALANQILDYKLQIENLDVGSTSTDARIVEENAQLKLKVNELVSKTVSLTSPDSHVAEENTQLKLKVNELENKLKTLNAPVSHFVKKRKIDDDANDLRDLFGVGNPLITSQQDDKIRPTFAEVIASSPTPLDRFRTVAVSSSIAGDDQGVEDKLIADPILKNEGVLSVSEASKRVDFYKIRE